MNYKGRLVSNGGNGGPRDYLMTDRKFDKNVSIKCARETSAGKYGFGKRCCAFIRVANNNPMMIPFLLKLPFIA